MVWYFISVYKINKILHVRLGDTEFLFSRVNVFHLLAALTGEIFFKTRTEISHLFAGM